MSKSILYIYLISLFSLITLRTHATKKKRVAGVGGEARAEQGDGRDRGAPGVRDQGARRRAPGSRV